MLLKLALSGNGAASGTPTTAARLEGALSQLESPSGQGVQLGRSPGVSGFLQYLEDSSQRGQKLAEAARDQSSRGGLTAASATRVVRALSTLSQDLERELLATAFDIAVTGAQPKEQELSRFRNSVQALSRLENAARGLGSESPPSSDPPPSSGLFRGVFRTRGGTPAGSAFSEDQKEALSRAATVINATRTFIDYEIPGMASSKGGNLLAQDTVDHFLKFFGERLLNVALQVTDSCPHPLFRRDPFTFTTAARVGIEAMLAKSTETDRQKLLLGLIKTLSAPEGPRASVDSAERTWLDLVTRYPGGLGGALGTCMEYLLRDLRQRSVGGVSRKLFDTE